MSGAGSGLFGTVDGSLFRAPGWVDLSKPPGATAQTPTPWATWAKSIASLKHVFYSPNLIWLSIAAVVYVAFPYDLEAAREWHWRWVATRAAVNYGYVGAYYAFWTVSLYGPPRRAGRKFKGSHWPVAVPRNT